MKDNHRIRVVEVNEITCVVSQSQGVLEEAIRVYGGLASPHHDQETLMVLIYEYHALILCFLYYGCKLK